MKNKFDARIFVVAALAVALAASTGCRSGWKMGNPFSKAPKATDVDTPSELDELNDLTPPPENYTVGDATPKKVDGESLAQKGKYEADETPKLAQTPADAAALAQNSPSNAPSADALAANLPSEPAQNFKTPDYSQNYQSADAFQTAQTPSTTQYQAPNAAQQYAATAPYVPTQSTPNAFPTAQNAPVAPQNDFPVVDPNAFPTAQNAPVAPQNDFPVVDPNAFPTAQNPIVHSTLNVAAQNAPVAPQNDFPVVDPNAFPTAQNVPVAPQNDFPVVDPNAFPTAQPAFVAQNFAEPAPQAAPTAATQDAYSGVHYQPQTTSGGFAPGSVGVY